MFINQKIIKFLLFLLFSFIIFSSISHSNQVVLPNNIVQHKISKPISSIVFEDFLGNNEQTQNKKLCNVRKVFEQFNLISSLHTFLSDQDNDYKNLLPTLSLLNSKDKNKLTQDLNKLNFTLESLKAA